MGKNEYYMKIGHIDVSDFHIVLYGLLIGDINVSDFHIVLIFNEYYTQIVAVLMKQMQNRNRNRQFPNTQVKEQLCIKLLVAKADYAASAYLSSVLL